VQVKAIFGYPVNVLKFSDRSIVGKYLGFLPVLLVENYQIIGGKVKPGKAYP
jgi:hypothetical protein